MTALEFVVDAMNRFIPEPQASLLAGMLFGVRSSLPTALREDLIRSGTLHIISLSGMNIAIIIHLTVTTLSLVLSKRVTYVLTVLFIIGFVWFVGPSPTIVRAGCMGVLTLVALTFGRQQHALFFLLVTTLVLVLTVPAWRTDISLYLSSGATLGLLLFGPRTQPQSTRSLWRFLVQVISTDLRTTLAAQVFTTPILMVSFHRVSLISPLANVLISWIVAPITVLGLIFSVCAVVIPPLAIPLAWALWLLLSYVVWIVGVVSSVPFASISW